ncbi:hypothetical protein ASF04_21500 [Duganella sp. Leaf61]|uniref:FxDxF family PEP-CTERM protein n=1 Tax=Duganella sp. Leaf61 TaxID=1736227 RepID=UPI0006F5C7ED|nr:FxDxF family PEP-CTERM protein [Duganella sp. Leaf61]KQN78611.1 hypothetical protein ASF04_21500 [Duganella sp. Leaf61]
MKIKKVLLASLIAGASLIASSAYAAEVSKTVTIDLKADGEGGYNAYFGNTFYKANQNDTFSDKFMFTLGSNFDSTSSLTSSYLSSTTVKDLVITSYNLVKYDPTTSAVLTTYTGVNTLGNGVNAKDGWEITNMGLTAGSYYFQVGGLVNGNGGGSYASDLNIAVAPVPEAETYAMMIAGLGLLGVVARRRKAAKQA